MKKERDHNDILVRVLDKGYVRMAPHWIMGAGDLDIANDARVSYMAESYEMTADDKKLIRFLGREKHTSCFRGVSVKLEVYAPLMLARQWWKYIIGSQHEEELQSDEWVRYQDQFTNWNESSRRYIKEKLEFHVPDVFYTAPENSKQGSGDPMPRDMQVKHAIALGEHQLLCAERYLDAITDGMCVEQARMYLPAYALYVRWRWTCSLQTLAHFINQRINHDAQRGIQAYAKAVYIATAHLFDHGLAELLSPKAKELLEGVLDDSN